MKDFFVERLESDAEYERQRYQRVKDRNDELQARLRVYERYVSAVMEMEEAKTAMQEYIVSGGRV